MHGTSWLFFAYIDPGGGELFLQILIGGLLAWTFRFRRAVLNFFHRESAKPKVSKQVQALQQK